MPYMMPYIKRRFHASRSTGAAAKAAVWINWPRWRRSGHATREPATTRRRAPAAPQAPCRRPLAGVLLIPGSGACALAAPAGKPPLRPRCSLTQAEQVSDDGGAPPDYARRSHQAPVAPSVEEQAWRRPSACDCLWAIARARAAPPLVGAGVQSRRTAGEATIHRSRLPGRSALRRACH